MTAFQTFQKMKVDKALLSLEPFDPNNSCFCYPMGATPIGCEGAILSCFLPDFGETVFACNPESCADSYVYPLAGSFEDFLRLILAGGSPNPPEQLAETFSLTSMEDPHSYGKLSSCLLTTHKFPTAMNLTRPSASNADGLFL